MQHYGQTFGSKQGHVDENRARGPCWVGEECGRCGREVDKGAVLLEVKVVEQRNGTGRKERL
jgi:hypothetical protein